MCFIPQPCVYLNLDIYTVKCLIAHKQRFAQISIGLQSTRHKEQLFTNEVPKLLQTYLKRNELFFHMVSRQSTLSACTVFLFVISHFRSLIFSYLSPPTLSLRCSLCNVLVWPQSFLYKDVQLMRSIIKACFLKYAIFNI